MLAVHLKAADPAEDAYSISQAAVEVFVMMTSLGTGVFVLVVEAPKALPEEAGFPLCAGLGHHSLEKNYF